jgi:hypothetical protein
MHVPEILILIVDSLKISICFNLGRVLIAHRTLIPQNMNENGLVLAEKYIGVTGTILEAARGREQR